MDELVIARHGESQASAQGMVGGNTPLTKKGRRQALALGERLLAYPLDICLTSPALRTRETAETALRQRDVPIMALDDLADAGFGEFEGRPLGEYRQWVASHPPTEPAPGGESRVQTLRRFAAACRSILERRERHILVVAHGLTIRALLDDRPQPVVSGAAYADPAWLQRAEFKQAVERLERWCESPAW
jgi:phosphoserine phosphatase